MKYDVFISCKSEDYEYAGEIYEYLRQNGISAFLASKELRKLGESEYRKAISAAMKGTYHMIVFASRPEYINSTWVYYEWDMFINAKLKGFKYGQIVTILKDVNVDDVDMDLWKYESFTFENYKEKLLSYVETPESLHRKEEDRKKIQMQERAKREKEELLKKRNETKKELIRLAEDYRAKVANLSTIDAKKIVSLLHTLGVETHTCPVCETKVDVGKTFCHNCGWTISPIDDIEDAEYLSLLNAAQLNVAREIYKKSIEDNKHVSSDLLDENKNLQMLSFDVKGVSFKMIKVEGGTFGMGATSEQVSDAQGDEKPVHSVTLSHYYIGETEVTQELWQTVMGSNPSYFSGDQKPVECVSWNDCQEFITKLNKFTGKNFRLPTEAEWEYAARGGNKSKGYKYSGSNTIGDVTWYSDNSFSTTHDVKTKSPNELGIYDMSGNVWEWCQDWFDSNYYNNSPQTNPAGPSSGSYRVRRGGSWNYSARFCRVSNRNYYYPDYKSFHYGFRLAL